MVEAGGERDLVLLVSGDTAAVGSPTYDLTARRVGCDGVAPGDLNLLTPDGLSIAVNTTATPALPLAGVLACESDLYEGGGVAWYAFRGTGGPLSVSACGAATDVDATLFLYQVANGSSSPIGSDPFCLNACAERDGSSSHCGEALMSLPVTDPSATYYVLAMGVGGEEGIIDVYLASDTVALPPASNFVDVTGPLQVGPVCLQLFAVVFSV